jgi:hypothetical protein
MPYSNTDDAAAAALYRLTSAPVEHMGLLYQDAGNIAYTPTQSRNRQGEVKGRFSIPKDSLRALFHNHPLSGAMKSSPVPRQFSSDDIAQAQKLGVPSYIAAGDRIMRYDPATKATSEVLAQFPIEEMKRALLAKGLLR